MSFLSLRSLERLCPPLASPLLALPLLLACDDPSRERDCIVPGTMPAVVVKFASRSGAAWSPGPYRVTVTVDGAEDACDFEVPEPPCSYRPGPDAMHAPKPVCTAQHFFISPLVECDSLSLAEGKYGLSQLVLLDYTPPSFDVDLSYRGETLVKGTVEPAYVVEEAHGIDCPEPRARAASGKVTMSLP